jgi:hypothetical protein
MSIAGQLYFIESLSEIGLSTVDAAHYNKGLNWTVLIIIFINSHLLVLLLFMVVVVVV